MGRHQGRYALILGALLSIHCSLDTLRSSYVTSLQRWQKATCIKDMPSVEVRVVPAPLECGAVKVAWGCRGKIPDVLLISRDVPEEYVLQIVMHEYGHHLRGNLIGDGSKDHLHAGTLMSVNVPAAITAITKDDIDYICERQQCRCSRPE